MRHMHRNIIADDIIIAMTPLLTAGILVVKLAVCELLIWPNFQTNQYIGQVSAVSVRGAGCDVTYTINDNCFP